MTAIHPQFITAGTEELVVITRAEFDLLMAIASREDQDEAEDIALFDARMAEVKSGAAASLPGQVSAAMLGGERLLPALRRWRELSVDALAVKAHLPRTRLDALEAGRDLGTPDELGRLADALEIDPNWLG